MLGSKNKIRVSLVGYGGAGRPLASALKNGGAEIISISELPGSPRREMVIRDGFVVTDLKNIPLDVDLIVLAVGDTLIQKTATELAELFKDSLNTTSKSTNEPVVMHLSGRLGVEPLSPMLDVGFSRLAFHPIQTFPVDANPERFNRISVGITADSGAELLVKKLAEILKVKTLRVSEEDRSKYHLASVLVSNFLPVLLKLGADQLSGIAKDEKEACSALMPLIMGMVNSLDEYGPYDAMTGPVARDDINGVQEHLAIIEDNNLKKIYLKLSEILAAMAQQSGKIGEERSDQWKMFFEEN
jgi:predicted short-subunit dehydrogenase-like oxidoreductase (DUF2520 family)